MRKEKIHYRPEVEISSILNEKFSKGQGVVQLQSGMSDDLVLIAIKGAVDMSNGNPFIVVPPTKRANK